jgi:hypothetical protein
MRVFYGLWLYKVMTTYIEDSAMPLSLHREYLVYQDTDRYMVGFEGEVGKALDVPQAFQITIESTMRGKPRPVERREGRGTIEQLKPFAQESLDREHGKPGKWEPFVPGSVRNTTAMRVLIGEWGPELAHGRLVNGDEPEIVALCGGLGRALAVWEHCKF